jgi:hypothetical protein
LGGDGMVTTTLEQLRDLIAKELDESSAAEKRLFEETAISPVRWRQSPWGDDTEGFWAVAVLRNRVLWFNEIEGGFNVSRFSTYGVIPDNEYWCNQDSIAPALRRLVEESLGDQIA